jgi:hypothetical protein
MKAQICPGCGQPPATRYGVALSPMRLRIFDLIERRPGITSAQITSALYPAHDLKAARRVLYTHIAHINDILEIDRHPHCAAWRWLPIGHFKNQCRLNFRRAYAYDQIRARSRVVIPTGLCAARSQKQQKARIHHHPGGPVTETVKKTSRTSVLPRSRCGTVPRDFQSWTLTRTLRRRPGRYLSDE